MADDQEILGSGQERISEEVHTLNGVARTFETRKGPSRDANGQVVGLIGVFADVTERKLIHEELQNARNDLQIQVQERTADLTRTNESLKREIKQHELAELALAEGESRYRHLVELSPDAICIVRNGEYVFVNKAAIKLFGAASGDDLIGKSNLEQVHPEYLELARNRRASITAGVKLPFVELKVLRLDGSEVDVEAAGVQFDHGAEPAVLSILRDITERKRAEAALTEAEERYRSLVELSPDSIVVRRGQEFVFANSAAARLYGADQPSELIGRSAVDLIHPDFRDLARERMEHNMSGGGSARR